MASSSDKLKILLFGTIAAPENEQVFAAKLQALQKSKAGPFDVAFCVGRCFVDNLRTTDLPIPVYIHDMNAANIMAPAGEKDENSDSEESENAQKVRALGPNLFLLQSPHAIGTAAGGIWSLPISPKKPELVVVACPWNIHVDSPSSKDLLSQLSNVSYTGCDLLLSHEWPQGIESCLTVHHAGSTPLSSFDVAHVALQARARYHATPGVAFQQSTAFEHLAATTNTVRTRHVGRFISLAPVTPAETGDTPADKKRAKYVHAVGIVPLHSMSPMQLDQQRPAFVHACPFTDTSYQKSNDTGASTSNSTTGLSEASARRILHQEQQREQFPQHRWASKRPRPSDDAAPVDPTNTVLFVHGLHHDVSGRLQSEGGDGVLLQYFKPRGVQKVRRPVQNATSSFCFLEFATHEQAASCLERTGGQVIVDGVQLTLKWGSSGKKKEGAETISTKRQRLTEIEAKDSSTIYFKLPPAVTDAPAAGESLRYWMEQTLEEALAPESDADTPVTAATEPALQVRLRLPQQHDDKEAKPNFWFPRLCVSRCG